MVLPCPALLLEELAANPSFGEKVVAAGLAWLAPLRLLEAAAGCKHRPDLDDLATVVFSSGSTGEPKGVMLSHYNLASNVEQIGQAFDFGPSRRFLGVLPFFHSFGFTATLLQPLLSGVGVVFHSNPLEGKVVGELIRRYEVTTLMAPPGFLQVYLRTCEPSDFGSVTLIMAGAEKLQEWLAAEFQKKFRIAPVEGYGCTECSPAVSVNRHDFRGPGIQQIGAQPGTIGRPLPGISVRIVDPETRQPVPVGQPGLLHVRGPNVMQGYLNRPDKTAEVLRDGWYETGDIAALHPDGFLEITDRLSRFSKIAGEMVPHVKVEEKLQALAGVRESRFAVVGVPDEKRGERLVVLHTLEDEALSRVLQALPQSGLPNLWIPKASQFHRVADIPLLGSGKLDLRRLREQALRLARDSDPERQEAHSDG
jgi:acyl-[acyl-carrier-protein]-phospholipid O-acyltransferase/long-chain-fatty-acid--[acyl-carrier-protein] ligase